MRDRRLGLAVLVIGAVAIALAQRWAPVAGPPLFDGVTVIEAYRWLVPPPGAKGQPLSTSATMALDHGSTPLVVAGTMELPPQAQIYAPPGALIPPPETTSITVSITPVLPATLPTDGHIVGNVYRITVANQLGVELAGRAGAGVTVVLRAPDRIPGSAVELASDQGWRRLTTDEAESAIAYRAVVTDLGDFAVVAPGPGGSYPAATPEAGAQPVAVAPSDNGGPPVAGVAVLLALLVGVVAGAVLLARARRRRSASRGAHPRRR